MANKKQERRTSQVNFRFTKREHAILKKCTEERGYTSISERARIFKNKKNLLEKC